VPSGNTAIKPSRSDFTSQPVSGIAPSPLPPAPWSMKHDRHFRFALESRRHMHDERACHLLDARADHDRLVVIPGVGTGAPAAAEHTVVANIAAATVAEIANLRIFSIPLKLQSMYAATGPLVSRCNSIFDFGSVIDEKLKREREVHNVAYCTARPGSIRGKSARRARRSWRRDLHVFAPPDSPSGKADPLAAKARAITCRSASPSPSRTTPPSITSKSSTPTSRSSRSSH